MGSAGSLLGERTERLANMVLVAARTEKARSSAATSTPRSRAGMRLGVRAKEVLTVTLLTFLVVAATTVVHLSHLTGVALEETARHARMITQQIYAQSAGVLATTRSRRPLDALRRDRELRTLLDASVAYSPQLLYAMITDASGRAILHSERRRQGELMAARPSLPALLALNPLRRVRALYGRDQIYEATLPMTLGGQPFATIRLGVALPFVRSQLEQPLRRSLTLGGIALVVAWGVALALSNLTLRPVRRLAEDMERVRRGEFDLDSGGAPRDEFGRLALQLQLLGQQIQSDRLRLVSEKAGYQHAVDLLEEGLLFVDADRRVLFVNRAAEPVVGRPVAEVVGAPLGEVLAGDHPLRPVVEDALRRRATVRHAPVTVVTDDRPTEMLVSVLVLEDGDRAHDGALVLLKDARALAVSARTLESLSGYLARLTMLGRATSEVTHEVRNPLNAIAIHLGVLREHLGDAPEAVTQSLEVIRREIGRLDAVVERFTTTIRPQDLALKPVDLEGLLRDATSLLEAEWREAGVSFVLALDPDVPTVLGDESLLRTALMNIIVNACQAMPGGGRVTITCGLDGEHAVTMWVSDTGTGISDVDMGKLFARRFTTKSDGSGIGLTLVRRVIELHGGDIEILSRVGVGTSVVVRLPIRVGGWRPDPADSAAG
jgi:signal transduction histidine kinase